MSAFLFKQTETAGAHCACGARTFGRGTGPAPRPRTRARARAGLSGRAGLGRAGLGRAGRKAGRTRGFAGGWGGWQPGRVDWVRRVAPPSAGQALSSHAGLGKRRGIRTGRSSRRLRSRPGRCPSSASSGLQRSGELWQERMLVIVIWEILFFSVFKGTVPLRRREPTF